MSETLYHHGVKGMKWGVRKTKSRTGAGKHSTKKRQDDSIAKDRQTNKESVREKIKRGNDETKKFLHKHKGLYVAMVSVAAVSVGMGIVNKVRQEKQINEHNKEILEWFDKRPLNDFELSELGLTRV